MSGNSGAWKDSRTKIGSKANHPLAVFIRGYNSLSVPDALFSCYTAFVSRNVTIRISDEAALWARRQAAEKNTSVSRLVGEMLERQLRLSDEYWRAFDHWKSNRPLAGMGAAERLSRQDVHERR